MIVSVVVPWRPGCPYRESSWLWVREWWRTTHPDFEVVEGSAGDGPWRKADAVLDGLKRSTGDVIIVADADVVTDVGEAINHLGHVGWSVPHTRVVRLDADGTERFKAGERGEHLPVVRGLNGPGKHTGTIGGGAVAIRRDVIERTPPDRRFAGWGQEDESWALALTTLHGKPWRGPADLFHFWHPPQHRRDRKVGSDESAALYGRYLAARRDPAGMRALVDESRGAT